MTETIEVKLTPSYDLEEGQMWVEVDAIWHISPYLMDGKIWGKLSENTLCGLTKIGYGREWGYRLVKGEKACKCCVEKGKYTKSKENNMQNYELILRKKRQINKTKGTQTP